MTSHQLDVALFSTLWAWLPSQIVPSKLCTQTAMGCCFLQDNAVEMVSEALLKSRQVTATAFPSSTKHLIIDQVGQAEPAFHEFMLAGLKFLIFIDSYGLQGHASLLIKGKTLGSNWENQRHKLPHTGLTVPLQVIPKLQEAA